jgi:outer membrane protein TolC
MDRHTSDHATVAAIVDLRLPLYAGGRISADLDAARANVRKAQHDEAALRLELGAAALVVYGEVLAAQERMRVSDQALSRAQQLLEMTRKRRSAGIDTEADVARAQLNLVRYEEEAAVQQGTLRTALATLRSVLLLEDRMPMQIVGSLSELATLRSAGGAHPEVARAHAALDEARARSRSAKANYLPNVDVFATGQYGNTFPGDATAPMHAQRFGPLSASGAVGVQAGWILFDFFATRDHVESTEAQVALRRADRDVAVFLLESRRRQAIAREQGARERLRVLQDGQLSAARALELARARYETGHATLTDVLTADLEGIRLQSNQVQASLELALAHVDRLHAEGAHP